MTTCACSHTRLSHAYNTATKANSGRCLSRDCGCPAVDLREDVA